MYRSSPERMGIAFKDGLERASVVFNSGKLGYHRQSIVLEEINLALPMATRRDLRRVSDPEVLRSALTQARDIRSLLISANIVKAVWPELVKLGEERGVEIDPNIAEKSRNY